MTYSLPVTVTGALRELGREWRERWIKDGPPRFAENKAPNDYVTAWDRTIETTLRSWTTNWSPGSTVLGEEQGDGVATAQSSDVRWIIDPIDGTTNLMHGLPHWAISLAQERAGKISMGWVYDVLRDEMFEACEGNGATCNGRYIHVSPIAALDRALVALGTPVRKEDSDTEWPVWHRVFRAVQDIRRTGSAALDLAWVAAGRLDAFAERHLHVWDWAAGALIVQEAGGTVTTWQGEVASYENGAQGILASNAALHKPLRHIVY